MRIYLVRHGQTEWNTVRKWQGALDIPLEEVGRRQAVLVAKKLKDVPFSRVYASDLSRAYETAERIAAVRKLPVTKLASLREIALGKWEGLDIDQIRAAYADALAAWETDTNVPAPGGESVSEAQKRITAAIQTIVEQDEGDVVVVTHNGVLRAFLCGVLHMELKRRMLFDVGNASVTTVYYQPETGLYRLHTLNDVGHVK